MSEKDWLGCRYNQTIDNISLCLKTEENGYSDYCLKEKCEMEDL